MSWLLLRVGIGSQHRYMEVAGEYCPDVEMYYPRYSVFVRPHGVRRPVKVLRPVYPGYIFVRVGEGKMKEVVRLPVRAYWVRFGGTVEVVQDRVVQRIKELEGHNELIREVKYVNPYRSGVQVKVHLPMADLSAIVVKLVGTMALVDLPVGRGMVPVHCMELI